MLKVKDITKEVYRNLGYNEEQGGGIFPPASMLRIVYTSIQKFLKYSVVILHAPFNEFERFEGLKEILVILDETGSKIEKPQYFKQGQNIHFIYPKKGTIYYQWSGEETFNFSDIPSDIEKNLDSLLYNSDGFTSTAQQSIIFFSLALCYMQTKDFTTTQYFENEGKKLALLCKTDKIKVGRQEIFIQKNLIK